MELKYRGRVISEDDLVFIRTLIADNPTESRRRLSNMLCEAWDWFQPNGAMKDMVCRGLMLYLHRAGEITLPPPRQKANNPLANRRRPDPLPPLDQTPVAGTVKDLKSLRWQMVRRTVHEKLFNSLIDTYHYLGYTQPVGEHLKYIAFSDDRPVGCMAWSSAPRHLGPRDRFIGWTKETRRQNIHLVAYNLRFLILPWVDVPNLASNLLGSIAKRVSSDWEQLYRHPIYLLETFIDPHQYRGTSYKAANWTYLGMTTGRGKADQTRRPNRPLKELWVYPLKGEFRALMGGAVS